MEHREERIARSRQYRESEKGRKVSKRWRESDRGKAVTKTASARHQKTAKFKATQARYRKTEKAKAANAKYWKSQDGKVAALRYRESDKGKVMAARTAAKRRATKKIDATLTPAEWNEILIANKGKCYWCKNKLKPLAITMDHVIPLSKGGHHVAENVVPACQHCNFHKHTQLWTLV